MTRAPTIVVGVDGSLHAESALRFAATLARALGAQLVLAAAYVSPRSEPEDAIAAERARAEDVAESARLAVESIGDARSLLVAGATAAQALHRAMELEQPDLLVVGSSERRRVGGLQPGSVAEAVLHQSVCPVAVVPERDGEPAFARIGVAVEDSVAAQAPLDLALRIAADAGGGRPELDLVHIARPDIAFLRPGVPAPEPEYDYTPPWLESVAAEASEHVRTNVVQDAGHPGRRLVQRAAALDLLVMGSRDLGGMRRLVLGSTSAYVVRNAGCPVIVVPAARSRFDRPSTISLRRNG
jgi:nucleotide-binding universal stress UspA family protein